MLVVSRPEKSVERSARYIGRAHALGGVDQEDLVVTHRRDPIQLRSRRIVSAEELVIDVGE
jgi:hypothetical protein